VSYNLHFFISTLNLTFQLGSVFPFERRDIEKKYKWKIIEINGKNHFLVKKITINKNGLTIIEENKSILYTPQYWQQTTKKHSDDWECSGIEALIYLNEFQFYCRQIEAEITCKHLTQGDITLKHLKDNAPDIAEHPLVQEKILKLSNKEVLKDRPGQPKRNSYNINPRKAELVFRVICYRQEGLKQTVAIRKVIDENRNIIPSNWNDPEENLKKEVQRLSKHSIFKDVGIQTTDLPGKPSTSNSVTWKRHTKKQASHPNSTKPISEKSGK